MSYKNFPAYGPDGTSVAVGAASTATLIADDGTEAAANDVMVDNPGPNDVYVKFGPANVVATLNSMRVPGNSVAVLAKGSGNTYMAAITASGSQNVMVFVGDGQ